MSLLSDLPEANRMADLIQEERRMHASRPNVQRFTINVTDAHRSRHSEAFTYRKPKLSPLSIERIADDLAQPALLTTSHIDVLVRRRSFEDQRTRTHYVQIWLVANDCTKATRDEMMAYFEFTHLRGLDYEQTVKEKMHRYVAAAITGEQR